MREIDIRLEVYGSGPDVTALLRSIMATHPQVHSGIELRDDGFGRVLPVGDKVTR